MRGGRILWGQIAVVFTIVLVMTWAATQWTAFRLGFQPQLGTHGSSWRACRSIIRRPSSGGGFRSTPMRPRSSSRAASSRHRAASSPSPPPSSCRSSGRGRRATSPPTARRDGPRIREIRAAGLLGPDGVVLGRYDRDYLRHDGPEHVLCFAPTRSGKGVGLVVPTLLTWPGSCIVHDIKGRELDADSRLPGEARPRPAVRSDQREVLGLQPAAGGPARRMGSPRRAEHRGYSGRSRKVASTSATIGKRPAIRCLSARSCMSSTRNRTRRWPASPTSCPIPAAR